MDVQIPRAEAHAKRRPKHFLDRFRKRRTNSGKPADAATHRAFSRRARFLSYYRPHLPLLVAVLLCAVLVAATAIALPLLANHIVSRLPELRETPDALRQLLTLGGVMLGIFLVQAFATYFVDYQGHAMGAKIEAQVRKELFEHCQEL